jgi:hypothetical protein
MAARTAPLHLRHTFIRAGGSRERLRARTATADLVSDTAASTVVAAGSVLKTRDAFRKRRVAQRPAGWLPSPDAAPTHREWPPVEKIGPPGRPTPVTVSHDFLFPCAGIAKTL